MFSGKLLNDEKQNIFVSQEGVLKVGDFGLAVMLGERSVAFQASTTGNGPQGTIRWMVCVYLPRFCYILKQWLRG
jgi:hypothetical protein